MSIIIVLIFKDYSQLRIIYILLTFFFLDYFLGQILVPTGAGRKEIPGQARGRAKRRAGAGKNSGERGKAPLIFLPRCHMTQGRADVTKIDNVTL